MNDNTKACDLIGQNIIQFFSERKARKELKKKHRLDKLASNIPADNGSGYEDFAPTSKIENGEEYIKALNWALKNKKVKNIALAGPYGSGKSSIIYSYLKQHPSTKALNISLAAFNREKKKYNEFKDEVELGILKQLFYKVDSREIPQSRYRKIYKIYYRRFVFGIATLFLLGLAVFWFFFPKLFRGVTDWIIECGSYYNLSEKLSYVETGIFGIVGVLIISYICYWVAIHFKIKEVNIADKATVSEKNEDESIFDRNIDEIIYFFEETPYDTVFIEDLDRFDSSEIFVKLRELNTILNNYDLIKRRIVFVYAIKDDMFKDEERTKFFDFIIPVIPIINSTNSGEELKKRLKVTAQETGICKSSLYDISASYITLVSPFIEDMRVLTSICNEFIVYKKTLQTLNLKDEEMFSAIIFKNLFPTDFAELETEKGIVKRVFEDKKNFVNKKIQELRDCNENKLSMLEGIEKDILQDLNELKAAFMSFLTENQGAFYYCSLNGKTYYYSHIMQSDFEMGIFNVATNIDVYYHENSYSRCLRIDNIREAIENSERNYIQRFEYLKNREENRKETIRKEIEENETSIMILYTFSLKRLLEEYATEEVLSDEVRKNKVLVYFLKKGFINENYADYINYFYPNSITSDEMNYVRGIRMEEAVGDFSYRIKNVAQVCDKIEDYEFKQTEALNYDVTDYLVAKKSCDVKCIKLFEGLAQGSNIAIEFIRSYVERKQNISEFIKILCKQYPAFWNVICKDDSFSENSKFKYLSLIFSYSSIEDIERMNETENSNSMENFILNKKYALAKLRDVCSEKMILIIEKLGLYFVGMDIQGVEHEVLDYIFEENRYELNIDMVTSIFEYKYPDSVMGLKTANYSTLRSVSDTPLMKYVIENFEEYVTQFVIGQDTNVCEDIHSVEEILERLFISNSEICKTVLNKESVVWEKLADCCKCSEGEDEKKAKKVIWDYVLEKNMVAVSWNNFMCYYEHYQLRSALLKWIEENIDELIQDMHTEGITDKVIKEILVENLSLIAFEKLIKKFKVEKFTNKLRDFDVGKIEIMVQEQYLPFSIDMLDEIREIAPDSVKEYIVYNKQLFFANIKDVTLNLHVIAQLLAANKLGDSEKIKLFDLFNIEDIDRELALAIRELPFAVKKSYAESTWNILPEEDRYKLLLNQLEVYSLDEIADKLSSLASDYRKLSDRTKRHKECLDIDDWGYNQQLLNKLKYRGYLTSVDIETYDVDVYSGNEHKKEQRQKFVVWVKKK